MSEFDATLIDEGRRLQERLGISGDSAGHRRSTHNDADCVYMDKVTGGRVLIGNIQAARTRSILHELGVTHIVNCQGPSSENFFEGTRGLTCACFAYFKISHISCVRRMCHLRVTCRHHLYNILLISPHIRDITDMRFPISFWHSKVKDAGDVIPFFRPVFDFVDEVVASGGTVVRFLSFLSFGKFKGA